MALTRLCLLICLICTFFYGVANEVSAHSTQTESRVLAMTQPGIGYKRDVGRVSVRSFDKKQFQKYSADRDFKYDDNAVVGKSLWQSFWDWFWSLLDSLFGKTTSGSFVKYLVACLLTGFAVYAIVKFSGIHLNVFSSKAARINIPYAESLENIYEIDFSEQIEAAVAAGNYRLAVRLYYLRTLKSLSDRNQINWQPEKTNSTYVNEISDNSTKQLFAQLTTNFEYIWYGNFAVNAENFNSLKERFDQFNRGK